MSIRGLRRSMMAELGETGDPQRLIPGEPPIESIFPDPREGSA